MLKITLSALMLWAGLLYEPVAQAAESPYPLASDSGRIEAMSIAESTLVVGGIRYNVAQDVKVEINGTYGAFTMLERGMRVHIEYLMISPTERLMVLIQELPRDVDAEET